MTKKKKEPKQQTLEATMGRSRVRRTVVSKPKKAAAAPDFSSPVAHRSSPRNHNAPPSSAPTAFSFIRDRSSPLKKPSPHRDVVVLDSSSSSTEEKKTKKKKTNVKTEKAVSDGEEDEDDADILPLSSSAVDRRRRSARKKKASSVSSQSESEAIKREGEDEEEEVDELPSLPPPKKILGKRSRIKHEDSSDQDEVLMSPRKKAFRKITVQMDESNESDDDKPLVTPVSTNRHKRNIILDDSDEDEGPQSLSSPTKRRRLVRRGGELGSIEEKGNGKEKDEKEQEPTPRPSQAARRKPRTEKEKARELLRRKRAGENINEEDLEEDEEDEEDEAPRKALYDSDSDNLALREFEDDDEGVLDFTQAATKEKSREKKKKRKKQISSDSDSDNDSDVSGRGSREDTGEEGSGDDWLVDDGEIGVPDDLMTQIPLEFTKHSHKPLKEHFRDVIEWCVQIKVNPGFAEKQHEIYRLGWQKLDDEVRALAQSKFASSAWKSDFYMALRARPYFTNEEVGGRENMLGLENCAACGRSGHPAKWRMSFSGSPYYKSFSSGSFLEPVDLTGSSSSSSSPSSSSSSDDDDDNGSGSNNTKEEVDEDGNTIPPVSKSWLIGSVCNSNAETAHSLLHWKFALLDWVDSNLEAGGYMTPDKLKERIKWKPKKKYKLVDKILAKWVEEGVVRRLWREFKETIEAARNKSTTGRFHGR